MQAYRRLQWGIAAFVLLYALIGNAVWFRHYREIYPIFSWDLFSYVPNEVADFGLRITRTGDTVLDFPIYFEAATGLVPDAQSIVAYTNIQALGVAIMAGQSVELAAAAHRVESLHLYTLMPVEYEIVRRRYSPLARWREGEFLSEEAIGAFRATLIETTNKDGTNSDNAGAVSGAPLGAHEPRQQRTTG